MKKELTMKNKSKFLNIISVFLLVGFAIRLGFDYYKINIGANSAPFYLFVIERSIEFVLPSIILFFASKYLKNKDKKK